MTAEDRYKAWLASKRNMDVQIGVFERGVAGVNMFPWMPDKITFKSGGVKFVAQNVMDIGEVKQSIGTNEFTVSWNSRFPGVNNKDHPFVFKQGYYPWVDPEYWQSALSKWKYYHTPLQLMITNTPIFHNVVLADYDVTYKEANGDYFYYVEFKEDRNPTFTVTVQQPEVTDGTERDWDVNYDNYTVIDGDTLWGIAQCYLGDALRWPEIYELNKDVIEETAISRGFSSSDNGHWIFTGTVLKLPGSADNTTSAAGTKIELNNVPMYVSSDATSVVGRFNGVYYIYDGKAINGRYRICSNPSEVGKRPVGLNVTGWCDSSYIA